MQQNKVDLLCGCRQRNIDEAERPSGSRCRSSQAESGRVLRADAPAALQEVLAKGQPDPRSALARRIRRGPLLEDKDVLGYSGHDQREVAGQPARARSSSPPRWFPSRLMQHGIQRVLDRSSDVFFGDLPILLDAAKAQPVSGDLIVLDRHFTYEPLALADGTRRRRLSSARGSGLERALSVRGFPRPLCEVVRGAGRSPLNFFRQTALPE